MSDVLSTSLSQRKGATISTMSISIHLSASHPSAFASGSPKHGHPHPDTTWATKISAIAYAMRCLESFYRDITSMTRPLACRQSIRFRTLRGSVRTCNSSHSDYHHSKRLITPQAEGFQYRRSEVLLHLRWRWRTRGYVLS